MAGEVHLCAIYYHQHKQKMQIKKIYIYLNVNKDFKQDSCSLDNSLLCHTIRSFPNTRWTISRRIRIHCGLLCHLVSILSGSNSVSQGKRVGELMVSLSRGVPDSQSCLPSDPTFLPVSQPLFTPPTSPAPSHPGSGLQEGSAQATLLGSTTRSIT